MPVLDNPRHESIARQLATGATQEQIERDLGYSQGYVSRLLSKKVQIPSRISELTTAVSAKAEWDAARVLTRLGEIVDVKASDFDKPREEWTEAMERLACEVEDISERSHDGVQAGDSKAWDKIGTRVRIRLSDKIKALELLGKHKAVDAFVKQQAGDTNILVVTADTARKVVGARKRLEKVIDVTPLPVDCKDST